MTRYVLAILLAALAPLVGAAAGGEGAAGTGAPTANPNTGAQPHDERPAQEPAGAAAEAGALKTKPATAESAQPALTQRAIQRNFMALLRELTMPLLPAGDGTAAIRQEATLLFCCAGELYVRDDEDYYAIAADMEQLAQRAGKSPALLTVGAFLLAYPNRTDYDHSQVKRAVKMLPPSASVKTLPSLLRGMYCLVSSWGKKDSREDYARFRDAVFAAFKEPAPAAAASATAQTLSWPGGGDYTVPAFDGRLLRPVLEDLLVMSAAARKICLTDNDEVLDENWMQALTKAQPEWEWFAAFATGEREINLAWRARGNGWGKTVTEEGWKGFRSHCAEAERALLRVWQLRPDLTCAPGFIMRAVMGRGGSAAEQNLWMQRARLLRPDDSRSAAEYAWYCLEPRWGGSAQKMRAYALGVIRAGRFDTYLPLYAFSLLHRSFSKQEQEADWRQFWREPEVQKQMDRLFPALLAEPGNVFLRERLQVQYALVKMWMGRYAEAKAELAALPQAQKLSAVKISEGQTISFYGQTWAMIQNELQANTGPYAGRIQEGEALVFAGKVAQGVEVWRQIIAECAQQQPQTADYLRWRGGYVQLRQDWDTGDWKLNLATPPAFYAVGMNMLPVVRWLVDAGASMTECSVDNRPAFYEAARRGQGEMLRLCLPQVSSEQLNGRYSDGWTTLGAAVNNGHVDTVGLLLEAGADINNTDAWGRTPLMRAAWEGRTAMVRLLLQKGADPKRLGREATHNALCLAVKSRDRQTVDALLEAGLTINERSPNGMSPLYSAVVDNNAQMVRYLLEKGADPNLDGYKDGWNALGFAASDGYDGIVKLLLDHGADIHRCATKAQTNALGLAVQDDRISTVRLLLERGADVNQLDPIGCTALYYAALKNHLEVAQFLLQKGANPEIGLYKEFWTCLSIAASKGHTQMVRLLLQNGADPERTVNSRDVLKLAKQDNEELLLLLKTAIAKKRTAALQTPEPKPAQRAADEEAE